MSDPTPNQIRRVAEQLQRMPLSLETRQQLNDYLRAMSRQPERERRRFLRRVVRRLRWPA